MKPNDQVADLLCELEYLIGRECFNTKSTTRRGNVLVQGKTIRYPVWCRDSSTGGERDTDYKLYSVKAEEIGTIKYKFGANHLYIGKGIINVLEFLEKRYGLDFNELEAKRIDK